MPDADQLLALVGLHANDPAVEELFLELHTHRRPELDPENSDAITAFVLVRRQGLELGFVDQVFLQAGPVQKRRRKAVPLVLYQVYFYTELGDISQFSGKLPFQLEWSDDRESARHKLEGFERSRRSYLKDAWTLPEFHLILEYNEKSGQLFSVLCQLPLHPWPERDRVQLSIGVDEWICFFGQPIASPTLIDKLALLDLAELIATGEDIHEIDFRYQCGLQLVLTQLKNLRLEKKAALVRRQELVLGAVRFLRSRELDARQWAGELPLELSFGDTPVTMIEKVGRPPDKQEDERLTGFAFWHLTGYDLHIQYSTVENYLTVITLMAPGYWS